MNPDLSLLTSTNNLVCNSSSLSLSSEPFYESSSEKADDNSTESDLLPEVNDLIHGLSNCIEALPVSSIWNDAKLNGSWSSSLIYMAKLQKRSRESQNKEATTRAEKKAVRFTKRDLFRTL